MFEKRPNLHKSIPNRILRLLRQQMWNQFDHSMVAVVRLFIDLGTQKHSHSHVHTRMDWTLKENVSGLGIHMTEMSLFIFTELYPGWLIALKEVCVCPPDDKWIVPKRKLWCAYPTVQWAARIVNYRHRCGFWLFCVRHTRQDPSS